MLKALLIMIVAMSLIPAGDAASKMMTSQLGIAPAYVVWTRFTLGALLLLPFTWAAGLAVWKDWRVWCRGLLLLGGISCITQALSLAPLPDVFGAFFIGPMVSFVLSVWLLKERAGLAQAALVAFGFAGVLLVVRPGLDVSAGLGWAVLAGCFYGSFLTASRWLAGAVPLGGLMLIQMVGPALVATPFAVGTIPDMTPQIAGLTLISAAFSMLGNVLMLFVYRMHEASKLAPFVYFQLVSAVLLGWLIFGDFPDAFAIVGMGMIVCAGSAVAVLQSRKAR